MRLSYSLIIAAALGAAAPAAAQNADNAVAPPTANAMNPGANVAEPGATSGNATAMPEPQVAAPPSVATPADTGTTMAVQTHRGFPWGVIGLLGLIGLFGVRKVKG